MNNLKKLQKQWYKKLKAKGFKDVEYENGVLKVYDSLHFNNNYSPESFTEKQRYYQLASQLVKHHPWNNSRDKQVWYYHSEGKTLKDISDLTQVPLKTVQRIVEKYREYICPNKLVKEK